MRLYTFRHSPNPLEVRLALAELGLAYDPVEVNLLRGEHRTPAFAAINPHGKVPVLEDAGLVLRESNAILAYLGKTRGGALWPSEPAGEALALQWMFFEAFSLGNACGTVWWADVVAAAAGREAAGEALMREAVEDLERALGVLDGHLASGRAFLLGDRFTLADCSVGVAAAMLRSTRLDRPERWPAVSAYRERLRARPSWRAAGGDAIHQIGGSS
jgi:glutathione S-transferase